MALSTDDLLGDMEPSVDHVSYARFCSTSTPSKMTTNGTVEENDDFGENASPTTTAFKTEIVMFRARRSRFGGCCCF